MSRGENFWAAIFLDTEVEKELQFRNISQRASRVVIEWSDKAWNANLVTDASVHRFTV